MDDIITRTRRGYAAFAAGDLDTIRDMLSPDVVWHVPGRSSLAGDYRGIDAVIGYFVQLFERSDGTFKADLIQCGALDEQTACAFVRITAQMPAAAIDARVISIFKDDGEGRTIEVINFSEDQYAMDEAMGPIAIALPDARTASPTPITT